MFLFDVEVACLPQHIIWHHISFDGELREYRPSCVTSDSHLASVCSVLNHNVL